MKNLKLISQIFFELSPASILKIRTHMVPRKKRLKFKVKKNCILFIFTAVASLSAILRPYKEDFLIPQRIHLIFRLIYKTFSL